MYSKNICALTALPNQSGFSRAVGTLLAAMVVAIGVVACGGGGSPTATPVTLPVITAFAASPPVIAPGQSSTLTWSTTGAEAVTLDQIPTTGPSTTVTPAATQTYVLVASNSAGSVSATATVTVTRPFGLVADTVKVTPAAILSDQQTLVAPTVRLFFVSDNDGRGAANTFQLQFVLSDGAWALGNNPERALRLQDGVTGEIANQATLGPLYKQVDYRVIHVGLSTDKRILFFTINGIQSANALLRKPQITLNERTNTLDGVPGLDVTANAVHITGLKNLATTAAAAPSGASTTTLKLAYRHYVALANPAILATDANATPDEHVRGSYFPQVPVMLSADLLEFVTGSAKP
ncbi:MAG: hypothetical protein AB7I35_02965 [Ramlibacter sp.]